MSVSPRNDPNGAERPPAAAPRVVDASPRFRDPTLVLLELEADIRRQQTEKELVFHLLNETKRLLPFRQSFALRRRHGSAAFQVIGVSSLAAVDRNVPLIGWIERLVAALPPAQLNAAAPQAFGREAFVEAEERDAAAYPFGHALWLPLRVDDGSALAGALLFADAPWTEGQQKIAARLADTYSHAWGALAGPQRAWQRWRFDRRTRWLLAAALALLCVFPVSMSALAPMEVAASEPAVIAAPLTGVVAEILVPPNSAVKANQPILRFEDTKLRNELELAQRRMQVAQARFASTSQAAIDSADANREVAIDKAELELATAQHDYARDLLAKAVLSSPVDGVAVYTDRRDWQGRPVETGQQIMKVANPERTEFSVFLPVHDSLLIEDGARVRIYLDSDPLRPIDAQLVRAAYQAEKTQGDTLSFRLAARASDGAAMRPLRIGTRGTAQIYGGKVPLIFYVLRRPITVLRQTMGW
ncbi:efflux RND transporter periplasmic adaptor subunit [Variovorax sp. KK3]|uniref:efflux RND transporter periplasmic adaptor subunit n=1 Tax=Variovorax sp. KK3 TaxID=1855728 RepID=UPI00097C684B|nr:HlyD family efflux transporter periplasmic adaptor subunit [Variovorax sp. KK3]